MMMMVVVVVVVVMLTVVAATTTKISPVATITQFHTHAIFMQTKPKVEDYITRNLIICTHHQILFG
jgi:hypothetical protein